jgi:hypothetical protein
VQTTAQLLSLPACERVQRIQLGGADPLELAGALACVAERTPSLDLLALRLTGPQQLRELASALVGVEARALRIDYDRVTRLLLGTAQEGISLPLLAELEQLEALSLPGYLDPQHLVALPLQVLDCWCRSKHELALIAALPHLRKLCLNHDESIEPLRAASRLDALALSLTHPHIAALVELPHLRALALDEPSGEVVEYLSGLPELARLELRGRAPSSLAPLVVLGALEHLALYSGAALDLGPLAELPRLRSLVLDLSRAEGLPPRGCGSLLQVRELVVQGRPDLRWFSGTALDAVTITGGIPPRMLPRLTELGPLRRLGLPGQVLRGITGTTLARLLPEIEELELLDVVETLSPDQFGQLSRLRRLTMHDLGRGRAQFFAEELPEVEIDVMPGPRDPLDLVAPFDWRCVGWPRLT